MGMWLSPSPYGDRHIETGSRFIRLPMWKQGFPLSIWGCDYHHFHMVIAIWKRGAVSLGSLYGNKDSPFPYGDVTIPVSIWWLPYGNRDPFHWIHISIWWSLYGNGEPFRWVPYMETGIATCPIGNGDYRFHMVIPVWKRDAVALDSPYGNGIPHFYMVIPNSILWFCYRNELRTKWTCKLLSTI